MTIERSQTVPSESTILKELGEIFASNETEGPHRWAAPEDPKYKAWQMRKLFVDWREHRTSSESMLDVANHLLGGYGYERIGANAIAVNMGAAYNMTVVVVTRKIGWNDYRMSIYLSDWGSLVERNIIKDHWPRSTLGGSGLSGGLQGEREWPSDYRFFVVLDGQIQNGWEYREDANDQADQYREEGLQPQVLTRTGVNRKGYEWGHWS